MKRSSASAVLLILGCGRSDPFAFDRFDEDAGAAGTSRGGQPNGGQPNGGSQTGGRPSGGTSTGGFSGVGACGGALYPCGSECVDLRSDERHCGQCFSLCVADSACFDGFCNPFCPGGTTLCGGTCTDISFDSANCGGCGYVCPGGTACNFGSCDSICGGGLLCGNTCVDPSTDFMNCGACGRACGMREYCRAGVCTALPNFQSYTVSSSPVSFVSACELPNAIVTLRAVDDDVFSNISLPWFTFFGRSTEFAWVSSNGILGFGYPTPIFDNECVFGSIELAVFAFWDDLITGPGGVCLAQIGMAPNRQYLATWNDTGVLAAQGTTTLTFSIVLSEGTNTIDVLYGTMAGGGSLSSGASASIGLSSESTYSLDCCGQPCVRSNTGRRYTPILR